MGDTKIVRINKKQNEVIIPQFEGPIQLTWEAVYTKNPDTELISEMPGVNVVSPTWFELSGSDGSIKNIGSLDYVNWAKKRDYQIWGLFSNAFDPDLTHEALKKYETRQSIIRQLLQKSGTCIKIQFKRYCQLVTLFCRQQCLDCIIIEQ